jgi:hypothetical protein
MTPANRAAHLTRSERSGRGPLCEAVVGPGSRPSLGRSPRKGFVVGSVLHLLVPMLALIVAGAGCRPQAVDRAARVSSSDATPADEGSEPPLSTPDARPLPPADAAPPPPPDAPTPDAAVAADLRPSPDRAPAVAPDAAPDRAPMPPLDGPPDQGSDQVAAVLALTSACATKLSRDYDLAEPVADGGAPQTAALCGLKGAVYWVADLAVTCDGRNSPGKCDNGHDTDTLLHNARGQALTSATDPYVVVPVDYQAVGLRPGAVVLVIDNVTRAVTFAVFGDSSASTIGAASYACAEKLGLDPQPISGGRRGKNVTYLAFVGAGAVPGDVENQTTIANLGKQLVDKLLVDNR